MTVLRSIVLLLISVISLPCLCRAEGHMYSQPDKSMVEIASENPNFSTLVHLLTKAGLVETLQEGGPFTIFVPLNSAFRDLGQETLDALLDDIDALRDILLYHVVEGEILFSELSSDVDATTLQGSDVDISVYPPQINQANVITADIRATRGVIHVIDSVLIPPANDDNEDGYGSGALTSHMSKNVVEVLSGNPNFSTLVHLLTKTGLAEVLQDSEEDFTVFAPLNSAFRKLGQDIINALLADSDSLKNILLYHVVPGKLSLKTDANDGLVAATIQGDDITVDLYPPVINEDTNVITAEVYAENGLIHVIDSVLIPPTPSSSGGASEGDNDYYYPSAYDSTEEQEHYYPSADDSTEEQEQEEDEEEKDDEGGSGEEGANGGDEKEYTTFFFFDDEGSSSRSKGSGKSGKSGKSASRSKGKSKGSSSSGGRSYYRQRTLTQARH